MAAIASDIDVDAIVAWRMGSAFDATIADWRSSGLNFEHVDALRTAMAACIVVDGGAVRMSPPPTRSAYDPNETLKLIQFAQDLENLGSGRIDGLSVFVARQDARLWTSLEYLGTHPSAVAAQLSQCRPKSQSQWHHRQQIMLWPHPYQTLPPHIRNDANVPWAMRKQQLFWRGVISGTRFDLQSSGMPLLPGLRQIYPRLSAWLDQLSNGTANDWDEWHLNYQRLRAIIAHSSSPDIDLKLLDWSDHSSARAIEWLGHRLGENVIGERIPRTSYMSLRKQYRYTLAIDGNDEPSSLREDLISGSCLLLPKPYFESCIHFNLRAGEHYVELKRDLSDLEEKLNWCREHDQECREISERAAVYAKTILNPQFEIAVKSRMIEKIKKNTEVL